MNCLIGAPGLLQAHCNARRGEGARVEHRWHTTTVMIARPVSPLNSIDTMSVSTMATFIAGWRDGYLLDATRAGLRRIPPPIRLRATALPAELRSRQLERHPAERPILRRD